MKKNVFLAVTLLAFIAVGAFAQQYAPESDFQVTKTATAVTITKYVGTGERTNNINIPPRIQNLPVTVIGPNAFASQSTIWNVTIPNGVTHIGNGAFNICPRLQSVTIPSTVTMIDAAAFANCPSLNSVTFLGTISPQYSIHISSFPDDLVGKFYATDKDKGTPGTYKKSGSTWTLTPAVVAGLNESDYKVTKTGNAITITGYTGSATVVTIPATIQNTPVTIIGDQAFAGNQKITSVTIPNGVTKIGKMAFFSCVSLASVTIPNSVTSIEDSAFENCQKLTSVTIPASVKRLGDGAFSSCKGIASVTFQGTIPSSAFNSDDIMNPFYPTDLRDKFYAANKTNGTPGTYTKSGNTWTKK
jgi:hypothetical protein